MSSAIAAARNRANAAHSTGPRTQQGKARSAQNALKLGLSIQRHIVLRTEDPAAFVALHAELLRIYAPQTEREELAVQEIAHCQWAFRRFDIAERLSLDRPPLHPQTHEPMEGYEILPALGMCTTFDDQALPEWKSIHNLMRYRAHWERRHQRAIAGFDRAQAARYREARERRLEAKEQRDIAKEQRDIAKEQRDSAKEQRDSAKEQRDSAKEQRAQQRHQMDLERHQMDQQRHHQGGQADPLSSSKPNKSNEQPQSGFVPYSALQPAHPAPAAGSPAAVETQV